MPTISKFYGILIQMYFDDHNPPYFHAIYNEYKAEICIKDFSLIKGDLPPKALSLVLEWTRLHQDELLRDWNLAVNKRPLLNIEPLN